MRCELWRQDDNGNRFLVGGFPDRVAAEERLAELTRAPHKQVYWITEQADEECPPKNKAVSRDERDAAT